MANFFKLYGVGVLVCFGMDLIWLGVVAKGFYQRQIGHLMRADVQWLPAVLFYLIYVAALVILIVQPAIEKQSLSRAIWGGALFGLAAYAAFDLTGMALLKDFPLTAALADLAWGTTMSATVCGTTYALSRWLI